MARPVPPWTWRRALRDHGPQSPSVLLTLFVIGTFMNRDGIAWPSQESIASGARASVRSVQRHIAAAVRAGWLGVELAGRGGQGWRHNAYRCAVPDGLGLDYVSETISDAIISRSGDISEPEGDDTMVSPASSKGHDTIVSSRAPQMSEGDDTGGHNVTTCGVEGDDTGVENVTTQWCRTNSGSETPASRTHASEEAQAGLRPADRFDGDPPPERGIGKIQKLLREKQDFSDHDIARITGQSTELVQRVREGMR